MPDPFDTVKNTDLQPRFPQQTDNAQPPSKPSKSFSFFGQEPKRDSADEQAAVSATQQTESGAKQSENGDGYELNFDNAAVTTVAKVILGDILGTNYTIDPRVQGTVTIASGRPVPKSDLIFVLENALRVSNTVLVPDHGGYRLIPSGDAQGNGVASSASAAEPGYGITVVPLRYVSAATLLKLLDSFALKAGTARADAGHNLILVQGTGPERRSAAETVLSFDVDWMRGQSVGVYPIQNAAPEAIITELDKIMASGENGMNRSLVTLQPIARLNAVLVVTQKPDLLKMAATWISRLDKSNNAGAGVHVYRMRYGDAKQVAQLLGDIFGTQSSNKDRGLNSAVNQIAPGGGLSTTSSNDQLASNTQGSQLGSQSSSGLQPNNGAAQLGGSGSDNGFGGNGSGSGFGGGSGSGFGNNNGIGGSSAGASGGFGRLGASNNTNDQGSSVALPGVRVTADTVNNALIIYASQENYRLIEQTVSQLDRPQLQVAIHATIAEVTLNNDLQYGVQYFLQSKSVTASFTNSNSANAINAATTATGVAGITNSPAQTAVSNVASTFLNQMLPGAGLAFGAATGPKAVLDALRTVTDVKVISSPSLVVVDNQPATLVVGDQVPVTTQSATSVTTAGAPLVSSINYQPTGVILQVSPRINANGNVLLEISQEVSNVAANANATTLTPTLSQRKIKSTISVASGQSVLLGGLISETQNRSRSGVPILEELPYHIGDAFAQNDRSTDRTELIVFIEPEIIRDSVDASKVAEELRTKLRGSAEASFPPGPSLYKDPRFVR